MLYKTHLKTGTAMAYTTILALQLTGHLPTNLTSDFELLSDFLVKSLVIYYCCRAGSAWPDIDQKHSYSANSTIFGKVINFILISMGAKHRSKHTHAIDAVVLTFGGLYLLMDKIVVDRILLAHDLVLGSAFIFRLVITFKEFLPLICLSLLLGALSHIFADFFTEGGAYISIFTNRLRLIPANISILGFMPFRHRFTTSNSKGWERFFRRMVDRYSIVVLALILFVSFGDIFNSIATLGEGP